MSISVFARGQRLYGYNMRDAYWFSSWADVYLALNTDHHPLARYSKEILSLRNPRATMSVYAIRISAHGTPPAVSVFYAEQDTHTSARAITPVLVGVLTFIAVFLLLR